MGSLNKGRVIVRTVTGTDPAAGAESTETVPAGVIWTILSYRIRLVTSADAGTRTHRLVVDDGTNVIWAAAATDTQSVSETIDYLWTKGRIDAEQVVIIATTAVVNKFPDMKLQGGWRIRTESNLDSTGPLFDNYAAPIILVEEEAA